MSLFRNTEEYNRMKYDIMKQLESRIIQEVNDHSGSFKELESFKKVILEEISQIKLDQTKLFAEMSK